MATTTTTKRSSSSADAPVRWRIRGAGGATITTDVPTDRRYLVLLADQISRAEIAIVTTDGEPVTVADVRRVTPELRRKTRPVEDAEDVGVVVGDV